MRGRVVTKASVRFVGASYDLDKFGKDIAGLEAEKNRLILAESKWKPFYYVVSHLNGSLHHC
jgi:hypothetical protein